jgi:hypothetical protein
LVLEKENILLLQMLLIYRIHFKCGVLEDGERCSVIRLRKKMKVRKIKDDSLVDPYIQELQMNLEQIERRL